MNINLNGQATQFDGQTLADLINTHTSATFCCGSKY